MLKNLDLPYGRASYLNGLRKLGMVVIIHKRRQEKIARPDSCLNCRIFQVQIQWRFYILGLSHGSIFLREHDLN